MLFSVISVIWVVIVCAFSKKKKRLKQTEYRCFGETVIIKFWDDFKENPEEKNFLLERLKDSLQNSGYKRWKEDFYDIVIKQLENKTVPTGLWLDAYALFELTPRTLTEENLIQAYRRLVLQYHPDKNKTPDALAMFQKVQKYYAYLEEELRRKAA